MMEKHKFLNKRKKNYMEEKQNRLRSWALWLSVFGALWVILSAFGLPEKWGVTSDLWNTVLNAIGTILISFGLLNNPTDKENF